MQDPDELAASARRLMAGLGEQDSADGTCYATVARPHTVTDVLKPGHKSMRRRTNVSAASPRLAWTIDEFATSAGLGRSLVPHQMKSGRLRSRKVDTRALILDADGT